MNLPSQSKYVIIGAGVHGLSTAYHLALQLKNNGSGKDIVIVDKKVLVQVLQELLVG